MRTMNAAPIRSAICGLAQLHPAGLATQLRASPRAFRPESAERLPARAAVACLRSIALPKQTALPPAICPQDNQKAYQDSFVSRLRKRHARALCAQWLSRTQAAAAFALSPGGNR